jgi:hypothetical protein
MNTVLECVRSVVALLVAGDWVGLERFTSGRRLSAGEIERAVSGYGRTLRELPGDALESLDVVEVAGSVTRTLNVRVPLWTLEEGRSDLEVDLTLREVMDGIFSVEVDDLHVA